MNHRARPARVRVGAQRPGAAHPALVASPRWQRAGDGRGLRGRGRDSHGSAPPDPPRRRTRPGARRSRRTRGSGAPRVPPWARGFGSPTSRGRTACWSARESTRTPRSRCPPVCRRAESAAEGSASRGRRPLPAKARRRGPEGRGRDGGASAGPMHETMEDRKSRARTYVRASPPRSPSSIVRRCWST